MTLLSPILLTFRRTSRARALGLSLLLALGLAGCNLQKDIDVPAPAYDPRLVVECYLVPGEPIRLLVQRTQPFAAPPPVQFDGTNFNVDPNFLSLDATAVITGPRGTLTMPFSPFVDTVSGVHPQFYTHTSFAVFDGQPGEVYSLEITDGEGHRVTGTTTVLAPVLIDTVEVSFNPDMPEADAKVAVFTRFRDPAGVANYYRYQTNKVVLGRFEEQQSYELDDKQFDGDRSAVGSSYRFYQGDTLDVALNQISRPYYDFLNSIDAAQGANGNPFAQPAAIKSTVQGGIGVFTAIAADHRRVILKR